VRQASAVEQKLHSFQTVGMAGQIPELRRLSAYHSDFVDEVTRLLLDHRWRYRGVIGYRRVTVINDHRLQFIEGHRAPVCVAFPQLQNEVRGDGERP